MDADARRSHHESRHVLNRDFFPKLNRSSPMGVPVVINAGRGGLQNESDILRCLDDGTLGGALENFVDRKRGIEPRLFLLRTFQI